LSKNQNLYKKSKFQSKIKIYIKNPNFSQKSKFTSKVEFFDLLGVIFYNKDFDSLRNPVGSSVVDKFITFVGLKDSNASEE